MGPWLCPWTRLGSATSSMARATLHPQTAAGGCSGHLHAQEVWLRLEKGLDCGHTPWPSQPSPVPPRENTKDHGPRLTEHRPCVLPWVAPSHLHLLPHRSSARDTEPLSQAWTSLGDGLPLSSNPERGSLPSRCTFLTSGSAVQCPGGNPALSPAGGTHRGQTQGFCVTPIPQPPRHSFPFLSIWKLVERGGVSAVTPTQEAKCYK